jgi:Adenylate kinase
MTMSRPSKFHTLFLWLIVLLMERASAFSSMTKSSRGTIAQPWVVANRASQSMVHPLHAVAVDEANFEGVDVLKLLGKNQLKRMARKSAAKRRLSSAASPPATKKTTGFIQKDPVRIIIAGAPASGKGTQCEIIKEKFGLVHLSTGDMLRAAVAAETQVGIKVKEYMDSGRLVPDEVIIGVVRVL